MKLSKRESKYRIKLIQEHHYNKSEQKTFDDYVLKSNVTYKEIYKEVRKGKLYWFMAIIGMQRLSRSFAKFGCSVKQLNNAIKSFSKLKI
jgi:hypothetical protein